MMPMRGAILPCCEESVRAWPLRAFFYVVGLARQFSRVGRRDSAWRDGRRAGSWPLGRCGGRAQPIKFGA